MTEGRRFARKLGRSSEWMTPSEHMAVSILTSHVFGTAKLISDAGGTKPAKFIIEFRTDPFAIWTDPFAKYMYICAYIYIYIYART